MKRAPSRGNRTALAPLGFLVLVTPALAQTQSTGFAVPLGLPPIPWPADNPYSPARAELGKILFFDGRLSANGVESCAFCHDPAHAFSGNTPLSIGVDGKIETRHTPSLVNRAWGKSEFWDGRAATLEEQVIGPLTNPDEMGMTTEKAVEQLQAIKGYGPLFAAAFGDDAITIDRITKALATFERTIVSGNSAYDRYRAGDKHALTKQQKDGLDFFEKTGECAECHSGPSFTNEKFVNLGIGMDRRPLDLGRELFTKNRRDFGKFKTPTLRDLSAHESYMHDGQYTKLGDVLDFYAKGGLPNPHQDTRITPFYMDPDTKQALLDFLSTLDGEGWRIAAPAALPQ